MEQEHVHHHVDSVSTYAIVWFLLLVLTGVTTAVSYVDLGPFSVVVALAIAVVKMSMVAWFFMHLRHSTNLTKVAVAATALFLGIMIAFTLSDIWTRGWMGVPGR